MLQVSVAEYQERLRKLQQLLTEKAIDLLILERNSDLYYYTGSVAPLYVFVSNQGEMIAVTRKAGTRFVHDAPWVKLELFYNTADLKEIIKKYHLNEAVKIGFALENTAYVTVNRLLQLFNQSQAVDLTWDLHYLRMIKSNTELEILRQAGKIMAQLPAVIKDNFRPGMTELELSALIENFMRLNGYNGLSRCRRNEIEMIPGVCSAGENALAGTKFDGVCAGVGLSPAVPYGASTKVIERGEPVVLDYAFNFNGYHLDQTRMFCWGKPSEAVTKAFNAMLQVEELVISELKPGQSWSIPYEKALQLVDRLGFGKEFMGLGNEKVRFVGHGVGLELDEPPYLAPKMNFPLAAQMVVAVEPKVALEGVGVIGNEDTLIIRDSGFELLTIAPPEMIIVD